MYLNQNTPGVKKVAAKNFKKGYAEKDVKSKWAAKASLLLMEFKFLIMMTRPQNITVAYHSGNGNVLQPGHHYQKFKFHQQQEALAAHFDFTSFSAQPFLNSWPQLFYTRGVLVEISFLFYLFLFKFSCFVTM